LSSFDSLNSPFQDKCPILFNNYLVFTSNRPGGYGGYDLYFSYWLDNDKWSKPINLGEDINSAYDEFRPFIYKNANFSVLIFSSNRPNGLGGYDLYFTKIRAFDLVKKELKDTGFII
jgi:hypothetical protein